MALLHSLTFLSILNLTKQKLEIKLVENIGGRVLVKHEAKLEENKGGGRGSRAIFLTEKKNLRY